MNQPLEFGGIAPPFQGQRLLAFSKFLTDGAREFETHVLGVSMGSALPEGSQVRIRFAAEFAVGQVVAYVAGDRIVAHRLVRVVHSHGDLYLITRGDASRLCDSPVRASIAMGIVTGFRNSEEWRTVPPKPHRGFGSRLVELAFSAAAAWALRINPKFATWTGTRLVQIRSVLMSLGRGLLRIGVRLSARA